MKRLILALVAVALFVGVAGEAQATGFGSRAAALRRAEIRARRDGRFYRAAQLRAERRREERREALRLELFGY